MKIETDFPFDIREDDDVRIPVTDGLTLSARIWRPVNASQSPVPAILEYIPYRKRFGTSVRDEATHPWLAGHGYACLRVDIRGSGESDGVLTDEYLQSELNDGVKVLEWIAAQDWCDGNVGMMGISWGGFNGLQIAAMRPPALKAIITVSSTDDRYSDDIHHMGGTLLGDNLSWSSVMFSYNTMPPDPALVGDRWRDMWMERLKGSGLWLKTWLQHQRRDSYWRHGSVCENFDDIEIPVFAVSGWTDGYTNSVFRLMEKLKCPRKGLVGPWGHIYPHFGRPGPAIDFLNEMLRWWDHWLKGKNTGVENDRMICAWMQESAPPNPEFEHREGRWISEDSWPSSSIAYEPFTLSNHRGLVVGKEPVTEAGLEVQSPVTLGLFSGKWCSYANGPDLASDQRADDGGSLVFQTEPLEEGFEIFGSPYLELELASDRPAAMVAVRLSDVQPDHQVARVTYGLLNLTHRDSRQHPEEMEPGKRYRVRVQMNDIAHAFPKGHSIRLSVSTLYWPLAWPSPEPVKLTLWTGESRMYLPVRPKRDEKEIVFGEPVAAPGPSKKQLQPPDHQWIVRQDLAKQTAELHVTDDRGVMRLDDIDLTFSASARERYSVIIGEYNSQTGETEWNRTLERGDWQIRTRTRTRLTCDAENFYIDAELDAFEGDARVYCQSWREIVPRDYI